jgi:hypothetical protein
MPPYVARRATPKMDFSGRLELNLRLSTGILFAPGRRSFAPVRHLTLIAMTTLSA